MQASYQKHQDAAASNFGLESKSELGKLPIPDQNDMTKE
jgi:hypothetical protein